MAVEACRAPSVPAVASRSSCRTLETRKSALIRAMGRSGAVGTRGRWRGRRMEGPRSRWHAPAHVASLQLHFAVHFAQQVHIETGQPKRRIFFAPPVQLLDAAHQVSLFCALVQAAGLVLQVARLRGCSGGITRAAVPRGIATSKTPTRSRGATSNGAAVVGGTARVAHDRRCIEEGVRCLCVAACKGGRQLLFGASN